MLLIPRIFKRKARFVGEGFKPGDYGKVATRNLRSQRMTSSVELPFMDAEAIYDASTMGVSHRRSRRSDKYHPPVGAYDTGRAPAVGREGLTASAACLTLVCLFSLLGIIFLVGRSNVIEAGKKADDIQRRIDEVILVNEGLETQLALTASEINVGYEAVQMGMISAKGVDVIYLNGPEAAELELTGSGTAMTSEYLATILGD